jgi:hypothetical protein
MLWNSQENNFKDKNGPQQWHRGKHKSQCIDLERH